MIYVTCATHGSLALPRSLIPRKGSGQLVGRSREARGGGEKRKPDAEA
jgi:hypothetical protein